jgi:hypothetical protein|tara:strand:+ start:279 stop:593 length:315 start_codon:yes stop_codon:yes gene_type:complete
MPAHLLTTGRRSTPWPLTTEPNLLDRPICAKTMTTLQQLNSDSTTTQQQLNNNYATNKLRHIAISYFLMVNHDKRHRYIKLAKLAQRPVLMFVRITALSTCSTK